MDASPVGRRGLEAPFDPPPPPARVLERLYGPLAQRLNPRALPLLPRPSELLGPGPRRIAVALDATSLEPEERALLGSLPDAALVPFLPAGEARPSEREAVLEWDLERLADSAAEAPLLDTLLAAVECLDAPPAGPVLMGVVNVTPDSFSDGGRFLDPARAVEHGLALAAEGAAWLDVGGESTRPGARPVEEGEELRRVLPVVEALAAAGVAAVSIDTTKSVVAREALAAGALLVNDTSAGRDDPRLLGVVAEAGASWCAMHRGGPSETMQLDPRYADAVAEVSAFLRGRVAAGLKAGVGPPKILLDPGIGFGKRLPHNLALLRRLVELRSLGRPLLVGVSRKSFIAHLTGAEEQRDFRGRARADRPEERLGGTAAALFACVRGGAEVLRVHDVRIMAEATAVARALTRPAPPHD